MLYIEKNEDVPLPKKFHTSNNICAIIYDQLTEILTDDYYKPMTTTGFKYDKKTQKLTKEFDRGEIHVLEWLKINELNNEIVIALTKHITMSILSDFVNFMYESLNCAKKGKLAVAYSLLRKPLTDELLILEQLLNDQEEFIDRFYHQGNPELYDPSNPNLNKLSIVKNAIDHFDVKSLYSGFATKN